MNGIEVLYTYPKQHIFNISILLKNYPTKNLPAIYLQKTDWQKKSQRIILKKVAGRKKVSGLFSKKWLAEKKSACLSHGRDWHKNYQKEKEKKKWKKYMK